MSQELKKLFAAPEILIMKNCALREYKGSDYCVGCKNVENKTARPFSKRMTTLLDGEETGHSIHHS